LPILVALVLLVFTLVDLAQSRADEVRSLPRWTWALVILLVPIAGPLSWLALGRPNGEVPVRPVPRDTTPHQLAPDDDPEFLARLRQQNQQAEDDRLRRRQADLERRERDLGRDDGDGPSGASQA
jgi:hypothetical protein